MPDDYHIAKRILPNVMDEWQEISTSKLSKFQRDDFMVDETEKEMKSRDEEAAKDFTPYEATIYSPSEILH